MLSRDTAKLPPNMTLSNRAIGYWFWLIIVLLDLLTKTIIVKHVMVPPHVIPVTDFFNLVLVWNKGTSFGLIAHGAEVMPYVLAVLSLGIAIWLHRWLCRAEDRWHGIALGLILGGAIGNVFDRLLYGAVVDFLDFHVSGWHWPAFNVADSAIVVGVAMLVLGGAKKTA